MAGTPIEIRNSIELDPLRKSPLLGDLYLPVRDKNGLRPAVILLFGGGWCEGDRSQQKVYGIALAQAGFVCLAADYRLSGSAIWPAQLDDVMQSLAWLTEQSAELNIDARRIGLSGNSSGGHLALMAAAASSGHIEAHEPGEARVAAVCAFYPPTELDSLHRTTTDGTVKNLLGTALNAKTLRQASPLTYAARPLPPLLLLSGNRDRRVPFDQSIRFHQTMTAAGNRAELYVFAGHDHAFDAARDTAQLTSGLMIDFFRRMTSNE